MSEDPETTELWTRATTEILDDRRLPGGRIDWSKVTERDLREARGVLEGPQPRRVRIPPGLVTVDGQLTPAARSLPPDRRIRLRGLVRRSFGV